MTSKAELQDLLRFLTQEAKLPLKDAMSRVAPLQKASLTRYDSSFPPKKLVESYINRPLENISFHKIENPMSSFIHVISCRSFCFMDIFEDNYSMFT